MNWVRKWGGSQRSFKRGKYVIEIYHLKKNWIKKDSTNMKTHLQYKIQCSEWSSPVKVKLMKGETLPSQWGSQGMPCGRAGFLSLSFVPAKVGTMCSELFQTQRTSWTASAGQVSASSHRQLLGVSWDWEAIKSDLQLHVAKETLKSQPTCLTSCLCTENSVREGSCPEMHHLFLFIT